MKWLIGGFVAGLIFVFALWAQMSITPQVTSVQSTYAITFGTNKTADTTSVTGGLAADKYIVTPTLEPNGSLWVVAAAGSFIINSTTSETTLTCNVVRFR